ncbi:MAG: PEP-CTERM sorting domain-containing protein [Akkermansiaceae bacterium]
MKTPKTIATVVPVLSIAAVLTASSAFAGTIIQGSSSIYTGNTSGNALIDPTAMIGPLGGGPNQNWNVIGSNSASGLTDSTGAATGVNFAVTYGSSRGLGGSIPLEVTRTFWQNFTKGQNSTITFSGLTAGDLYNVALVSVSNSSGSTEDSIGEFSTANNTTSPSLQAIDGSTRNVSTFVLGQNYVLFENVEVDASGEIQFLADAADIGEFDTNAYRLQLNAFQLEAVVPVIPEPSSITLLGLGALAMLRRRR